MIKKTFEFLLLASLTFPFLSCKNHKVESSMKFLTAEGKNIKTVDGQLVNLRGVNIGGCMLQEFWMTPTNSSPDIHAESDIYRVLDKRFGKRERKKIIAAYQSAYFSEDDFKILSSLGANCIRLPFWWRNIADEKGRVRKNAFSRLDWFLEMAEKYGMYVILDMHGLPGSQNGSDHSGVDGLSRKKEASEFFFGKNAEKNQEIFYSLWKKIAVRYRGNPVVAGYDLMNEPFCTYRYNSGLTDNELHSLLWKIYDRTYKLIRSVDSDHMIFFEATWNPEDLPAPEEYGWKNVVYEYHNYLYSDTYNAGGKQIENMQKKLELIREADYNLPSYMGEFNYFNSLDAWDKGLKLLTDAGISWTMWTYKTVPVRGNWGLVHHAEDVGGINIEYLEKDELIKQWSRAGEINKNTELMAVFQKYCQMDAVEYSLDK